MVENFTIKQGLIAAGLSKGIPRKTIAKELGITEQYISNLLSDNAFLAVIEYIKKLEPSRETRDYRGIGTLKLILAKAIYQQGEKEINATL